MEPQGWMTLNVKSGNFQQFGGGYSGDAARSNVMGILSAEAVNAHADASFIRRNFRARPSSHSYAMLNPPSSKEAFQGI